MITPGVSSGQDIADDINANTDHSVEVISKNNEYTNPTFSFIDTDGTIVFFANGGASNTPESCIYGGSQIKMETPIGDRTQIKTPFNPVANEFYTLGFIYKTASGTVTPVISTSALNGIADQLSVGVARTIDLADGHKLFLREGVQYSSSSSNAEGFNIDLNNSSGGDAVEVVIISPILINAATFSNKFTFDFGSAFTSIETITDDLETRTSGLEALSVGVVSKSNQFINPSFSFLDTDGNITFFENGTASNTPEDCIFGGSQIKMDTPIGDRTQIIAPFNPRANQKYTLGFIYKTNTGTVTPIISTSILNGIADQVSVGVERTIDYDDNGHKLFLREGIEYSSDSENSAGFNVDLNNGSGGDDVELVIISPIIINAATFSGKFTFDFGSAFKSIKTLTDASNLSKSNQWRGKIVANYGDSITASANGDFVAPYTDARWSSYVAKQLEYDNLYVRGIGGTKYDYDTVGGSVAFIDSVTGEYHSRDDGFNYDNYAGSTPAGTTKSRSAFSSWLRITLMFPASIKDTIETVYIMGATNDSIDATALAWVDMDTTDAEWAASGASYYDIFDGDFNLNTLQGGIASTIMKMQAWMPQALIIIGTPLSGRGDVGVINLDPITDEYTKSIYVREAAATMAIPLIDVNAKCGINGLNRVTYIVDEVHPTLTDGHDMLARTVIGGMKAIAPIDIETT